MLTHKGTRQLRTPRLLLRRFTADDAPAMFRNWASDSEVTRYLTWPTHANRHITEEVIRQWIRGYQRPDFYQWAIQLKDLGQPVGSIAVVSHKNDADSVQVGYCLGKQWWKVREEP